MSKSSPIWQDAKVNIFIPATLNISNFLLYYVAVIEYVHIQSLKVSDFVKATPEWKPLSALLIEINKYYLRSDTFAIFDKVVGFDQEKKIKVDQTLDNWIATFRKSTAQALKINSLKNELNIENRLALTRDEMKIFNNWYDYHYENTNSVHRAAFKSWLIGDDIAALANILFTHHPSSSTILYIKANSTHTHNWKQNKEKPFMYECSGCPEVTMIGEELALTQGLVI